MGCNNSQELATVQPHTSVLPQNDPKDASPKKSTNVEQSLPVVSDAELASNVVTPQQEIRVAPKPAAAPLAALTPEERAAQRLKQEKEQKAKYEEIKKKNQEQENQAYKALEALVKGVLAKYDSKGTGKLNSAQFARFLKQNVDQNLTQEQIDGFMDLVDIDGSKHVELKQLITLYQTLMQA